MFETKLRPRVLEGFKNEIIKLLEKQAVIKMLLELQLVVSCW